MANFNTAIPEKENSFFDGDYFEHIGISIVVYLVSILTLGIAYPWMCCWMQRWKAKHTVVCGKRMYFDGTGLQLFGKYILWYLLLFVTFGIYGFWMSISMKNWIAKHTHYEGEKDNNSYFDGGVLGLIGTNILSVLVFAIPFVGPAWSRVIKLKWISEHTVIDSRRHIFIGSMGDLFVKQLLWGFLSLITLGIFALFRPVKEMRWETENTIDNEHTHNELIARSEYRSNIHTDAASFKTYKVEYDMECIRAGITETIAHDDLLALAEKGVRTAQYTYVVRYAQEQYTQDPYSSLLKAAAEADYAPAICLYLQTHNVDADVRTELLKKAADKGQIWAVKTSITDGANAALAIGDNKEALEDLKNIVYYADLLKENHVALSAEEEELVKKCELTIRRIQSIQPTSSGKAAGIIVAAILGVLILGGIGLGAVAALTYTVPVTKYPDEYYYQDNYYDSYDSLHGETAAESLMKPQMSNRFLRIAESIYNSIFGSGKVTSDDYAENYFTESDVFVGIRGNQIGDYCYQANLPIITADGVAYDTIDPTQTGTVTVINFWGTWCAPCVNELPYFEQVASEYDNVTVIAVHSVMANDTTQEFIAQYYPESPLIFSVEYSEGYNGDYYNLLGGIGMYPYTVVLDENGVITHIFDGEVTYEALKEAVEYAMNW